MSINQPISMGTEEPEYFAELLSMIPRQADRRLVPSDESNRPIQNVDGPLAKRLQILLNVIADISLTDIANVAATMVCLKNSKDEGTLETQLYVVFNHERDTAHRDCPQHLDSIFESLRQVPYQPSATAATAGSRKVTRVADDLINNLTTICKAIHNYSFRIFAHRVNKRAPDFSKIQEIIGRDSYFTPEQRSTLMEFLLHVDGIIIAVADAQESEQLSTSTIQMLIKIHAYWTKHKLLPEDGNQFSLLDFADDRLAKVHRIGFQLRRWALKIMSFVISANTLFSLTQSHRLHVLLKGKFSVKVFTSPPTTPYQCDISPEAIQKALDTALAGTSYFSADRDEDRKWFIEELLKQSKNADGFRKEPTVHAELALVMEMAAGNIKDVTPYIGVSKHSCTMCSEYIRVFNEVMDQKIATKGSHGKAYPGWSWPNVPNHDGELHRAFLKRIKERLFSDFEHWAKTRGLSDSSVGPYCPTVNIDVSDEELSRWAASQKKRQ